MLIRPIFFTLLPVALVMLMTIASAETAFADISHEKAKKLRDVGAILPLDEIVRAAIKRKNGRVIEAELEKKRGRYVYEIEILDKNGIVWELYFDAKSGKFLKAKEDD